MPSYVYTYVLFHLLLNTSVSSRLTTILITRLMTIRYTYHSQYDSVHNYAFSMLYDLNLMASFEVFWYFIFMIFQILLFTLNNENLFLNSLCRRSKQSAFKKIHILISFSISWFTY